MNLIKRSAAFVRELGECPAQIMRCDFSEAQARRILRNNVIDRLFGDAAVRHLTASVNRAKHDPLTQIGCTSVSIYRGFGPVRA